MKGREGLEADEGDWGPKVWEVMHTWKEDQRVGGGRRRGGRLMKPEKVDSNSLAACCQSNVPLHPIHTHVSWMARRYVVQKQH